MEPAAEADRQRAVLERLRGAADAAGFLPFDRFMEIALYARGVGYYEAEGRSIGASGDFYTAGQVHPLFGASLAGALRADLERLPGREGRQVVELGAGEGRLAEAVLTTLDREMGEGAEFEYVLVERSAALRDRAMERLSALPGAGRVRVAESLSAYGPVRGVVIANELLDAQPVRRFRRRSGEWAELGVRWDGERFTWAVGGFAPASLGLPSEALEGTVLEVSPGAEAIVREVGDGLEAGAAYLIDYGAEEGELLAGHPRGTLQAVRAHRPSEDPLEAPGSSDLSAWVNFTRVRRAARQAGLAERAFDRQREALVRWGVEGRLAEARAGAGSPEARVRLDLLAKNLLFGFENFQVLELTAAR